MKSLRHWKRKMYDPKKAHEKYIHRRNSRYYKWQYCLAIAEIVENEGVGYKEANRIYWRRLNALKVCYTNE